jgi:hypothetical protein
MQVYRTKAQTTGRDFGQSQNHVDLYFIPEFQLQGDINYTQLIIVE